MYQEPVNSPDTLQDLCIFFCVEHLECLTPGHSGVSGSCVSYSGEGDTVTHEHDLPTALCDKLLVRYIKTCLPDQKSGQKYDALQPLLRRKNVCSKLSLLRREILTENDICDISNSSITRVNLFCCNELITRNMLVSNPQLTSLCLVAIDVNSWCPQVSKLKHLTSLTLSSCSQKTSAPVPFSQHLTQLENLR